MGMMAAAIGVQAAGQMLGGVMQAQQARASSQLARRVARQRARSSRAAGRVQAQRMERAGRRELGAFRASMAARGVRMEGSPLEAATDRAMEIAQDVSMTRHRAEMQAREAEFSGQVAAFEGRQQVTSSLLGGAIGAAGTGASGVARMQAQNVTAPSVDDPFGNDPFTGPLGHRRRPMPGFMS